MIIVDYVGDYIICNIHKAEVWGGHEAVTLEGISISCLFLLTQFILF